jgi:hypothetical protein
MTRALELECQNHSLVITQMDFFYKEVLNTCTLIWASWTNTSGGYSSTRPPARGKTKAQTAQAHSFSSPFQNIRNYCYDDMLVLLSIKKTTVIYLHPLQVYAQCPLRKCLSFFHFSSEHVDWSNSLESILCPDGA